MVMTSRISNDMYHTGFDLITSCIIKQHNTFCYHMVMTSRISNALYRSGFDFITMYFLRYRK